MVSCSTDAAVLMDDESSVVRGSRFKELFTVPRNRRAAQAAFIVMFCSSFAA